MYLSKSKNARTALPDQADFAAIFYRIARHPDAPESGRILHIFRLLSGLEKSGARAARFARLRVALEPYSWQYCVADSRQGIVAFLRGVIPEDRSDWEWGAVATALSLIEHGQLWRLYECPCGKLGFAPYKRQTYCSKICKSCAYYSVPENKEAKLQKLRDNRQLKKRIDAVRDKGVGYTGKLRAGSRRKPKPIAPEK